MDLSRERFTPHSPDVLEREISDGGFSQGWGMHFQPVAKRFVDAHGHIQFVSFERADEAVLRGLGFVSPLGVDHVAVCSPVVTAGGESALGMDIPCVSGTDGLEPYLELAGRTDGLTLMLFLHHENPDVRLVRRCAGRGVRAVKLHNAPVIVNAADPALWLGSRWAEVFDEIERAGLPVLWHVTQRLSDSPYTGGSRNVYWREGWEKGIRYTNEDLLQIYLKVVEDHPGIPFLSAHQLHLGWERLDGLMERYANLYIDTSVGCVVREGDRLYEQDRDMIRDFFIRRGDRILFGTDYFITDDAAQDGAGAASTVGNHIRFLRQLRLPYDVLQLISHGNAERLLGIPVPEEH